MDEFRELFDDDYEENSMAAQPVKKEETMKKKSTLDTVVDFVKEHKLEIAAGIGISYLSYKFGAKKSFAKGYDKGIAEGMEQEFLRAKKFMEDIIAPEADVSYEVIRTVTNDGYNRFISKPIVVLTQDQLNDVANIVLNKSK